MQETTDHLYSNIAENIPVAVFIYKRENGHIRIEHTNAFYRALPFMTEEELKKKDETHLLALIHPDDRMAAHAFFMELFEGRHASEVDYRSYPVLDDKYHWYHLNGKPVEQEDGSILAYVVFTDITEEKEKEIQALKREQMYKLLSEQSKQIIFEYNARSRQIHFQMDNEYTRQICEAHHMPAVMENVPASFLGMVDVQSQQDIKDFFAHMDQGDTSSPFEYRILMDGKIRWCRINTIPVFDSNGRPVTVYCSVQDMTDLKEQEQRYMDFFHNLDKAYPDNLGSFHLNLTKNLCYDGQSPYAFVLKQKESGTVDGYFAEFSKLLSDPKTLTWFRDHFTREKLIEKFKKGRTTEIFEYNIHYPDGLHWRRAMLIMNQNPRTEDIEAVTYAINIDEQKKRELINDCILDLQFEDVGILYLDQEEFEYVRKENEADSIPLGKRTPCPEKRETEKLWFTNDEEREYYFRISELEIVKEELQKNNSYSISYLQTLPDGRRICHQVHYVWLDQKNNMVLAVQTDVTASYEHEEKQITEIKKALADADKANEEKSKFLSSMSHDLRTPLNGVIGFTNFALKEKDPVKVREYLNKIDTSGRILLNLINETLELSRIESGKATLEQAAVLPQQLICEVVTSIRPTAEEKKISLVEQYGDEAGRIILCDGLKLQRIALNIISNAVKYTKEDGQVTVRAGLQKNASTENAYTYTLCVQDNGIGMSKEFLERAFYPFSQEKRSEIPNVTGTGLGLAIVKQYADLMKGTIQIESQMHVGTKITVALPVELADTETADAAVKKNNRQDAVSLKGKRVLLCEDNYLNTEITVTMLKEWGMKVDTAENGAEGIAKYRSEPEHTYAAILMDLQMPVMNGYEASEKIRQMKQADALTIPIIALSADAFEENQKDAEKAGMNAFVIKPIMPEKLFEALQKNIQS